MRVALAHRPRVSTSYSDSAGCNIDYRCKERWVFQSDRSKSIAPCPRGRCHRTGDVRWSHALAPYRSSPAPRDIYTRVDLRHTEQARARAARMTVIAQVTISKLRAEGSMRRNRHWKSKLARKADVGIGLVTTLINNSRNLPGQGKVLVLKYEDGGSACFTGRTNSLSSRCPSTPSLLLIVSPAFTYRKSDSDRGNRIETRQTRQTFIGAKLATKIKYG
ncbi:hypothetical protein EVAR_13773_1 [Eumeta japonica]|uniref:Uncharacterized protein n=1 Tax=Eumeta variegata TaxID=151549 RepID=A0A4C1U1E6_EUMVA|nr:hypothetical protein EVAR_13773_1 [Eumeta japonica]